MDKKKPQHIRNFWIETACDNAHRHATGTVKDAGFTTTIQIRYHDEPYKALEIVGKVDPDDGSLLLMVTAYDPNGDMHAFILPFGDEDGDEV